MKNCDFFIPAVYYMVTVKAVEFGPAKGFLNVVVGFSRNSALTFSYGFQNSFLCRSFAHSWCR